MDTVGRASSSHVALNIWNPFDATHENFPDLQEAFAHHSDDSDVRWQAGPSIETLATTRPVDIPLVFPPGYGEDTDVSSTDEWFDAETARKIAQVSKHGMRIATTPTS
jgi:hypothetical protein